MFQHLSSRLSTIVAFLVSFLVAFALLSHAAHGAAGAGSPDGGLAAASAQPPSAPAAAAPPSSAQIPDPEQEPAGFVEAFLAWWRNGGKVPAVLVVVIGLMSVLRRRVAWLKVGWRATVVTLSTVLLATLLDTWLSVGAAGNIWTWLLGGVGAVIGYLVMPRSALRDDPDEGGQRKISLGAA
jgi:hypothetical protein